MTCSPDEETQLLVAWSNGDSSAPEELRFFGGMSVEESAEVLGVSPVTVMQDWSMPKAWLYRATET